MKTRVLPFLFSAVVALATTTHAAPGAVEVARIKFTAGHEEFELSAANGGVQTLSVTAAAADILWISPGVTQKFSGGQLSLRVPVAGGEVVLPGRPQSAPEGGTLFVFTKISPDPVTASGPPPTASPAMIAPPADVAPPPLPAPASPVAPAPTGKPTVAALLTAAGVGASGLDLEAIARQLEPAVKMDPLSKADFAIPESPGAAVLDQTVQILRPASPRQTTTALLSNFDPNGALRTGFSIAITPYSMLRARPVTLAEYNQSDWTRFLTNVQVSFAAKTGSADASGTTSPAFFGLGLSAVVFDQSDPRQDINLINQLKALFPAAWGSEQDAEDIASGRVTTVTTPVDAKKIAAHRSITQAAQNAHWNASALGFGYALRLRSANGHIDDAKADGGGAWLNYSRPGFGALETDSQFLFTASYRYHDAFTRDGVSGLEDSFHLAAQFRFGTRDFNGFGQAVHNWRAPRGLAQTTDTTIELGLERKMVEGLWLSVSWTNDKSLGGSSAVKTGLRYGFGQAATLGEQK